MKDRNAAQSESRVLPICILSGTFQPRSPLYFHRSTSIARLLKVKLQITPNAYASPSMITSPRDDDDGEELHANHQIDNPVTGAKATLRLAEPIGEDAILGDAHQHAGRTDDRSIDGAAKNQKPDDHDKDPENNTQRQRPNHVHRHAGDQVVAINRHPHRVRNQHHRQQRADAGKDEAIDRNDDRRALQVLELGMLNLAIDLRQRLFAAHRQHRMTESHDDAEQAQRRGRAGVLQKAERILAEVQRWTAWASGGSLAPT